MGSAAGSEDCGQSGSTGGRERGSPEAPGLDLVSGGIPQPQRAGTSGWDHRAEPETHRAALSMTFLTSFTFNFTYHPASQTWPHPGDCLQVTIAGVIDIWPLFFSIVLENVPRELWVTSVAGVGLILCCLSKMQFHRAFDRLLSFHELFCNVLTNSLLDLKPKISIILKNVLSVYYSLEFAKCKVFLSDYWNFKYFLNSSDTTLFLLFWWFVCPT